MNQFLNFVDRKVRLDNAAKEKLTAACSEKEYKKGEALLKIGASCEHFYFINKGLVKLSFDTDDGEFIMRFFQEHILFTELESLTSSKSSKYQIVALEDVSCTRLPFVHFNKLCAADANIAMFYSKLLTMAHINMMNRISEMLESNAKTRYNNFLNQNADIVNRISLGDLSKYLGINQVTLSRIRKKK